MKNEIKSAKFKQGFLYEVLEDIEIAFKIEGKFMNKDLQPIRKMIIPKGEILEFRYYSPAHFRDVFNHFFVVDESQEHKLKEVAQIWENVFFSNKCDLHDILRLSLYKRTDEQKNMTNLPVRPPLEEHFEGVDFKHL